MRFPESASLLYGTAAMVCTRRGALAGFPPHLVKDADPHFARPDVQRLPLQQAPLQALQRIVPNVLQ